MRNECPAGFRVSVAASWTPKRKSLNQLLRLAVQELDFKPVKAVRWGGVGGRFRELFVGSVEPLVRFSEPLASGVGLAESVMGQREAKPIQGVHPLRSGSEGLVEATDGLVVLACAKLCEAEAVLKQR